MQTDLRNTINYAYQQFLRDPASVHLPLPISVFSFRITDTAFGFVRPQDRVVAWNELTAFAEARGFDISYTRYRDVRAPLAAQIILFRRADPSGGYSIHHGGVVRPCVHARNVVTGKRIAGGR